MSFGQSGYKRYHEFYADHLQMGKTTKRKTGLRTGHIIRLVFVFTLLVFGSKWPMPRKRASKETGYFKPGRGMDVPLPAMRHCPHQTRTETQQAANLPHGKSAKRANGWFGRRASRPAGATAYRLNPRSWNFSPSQAIVIYQMIFS